MNDNGEETQKRVRPLQSSQVFTKVSRHGWELQDSGTVRAARETAIDRERPRRRGDQTRVLRRQRFHPALERIIFKLEVFLAKADRGLDKLSDRLSDFNRRRPMLGALLKVFARVLTPLSDEGYRRGGGKMYLLEVLRAVGAYLFVMAVIALIFVLS